MSDARLDEQVCFALHAASRQVTAAYRGPLAELGLTYPQYLVMLALWEDDGLSVSALGERLHLDSGTLSPLLKRLEAQGRVRRRPSVQDERRVHVDLTADGHRLREDAAHVQRCVLAAFDLEPEELVALRTLARRVAALEPGVVTSPPPSRSTSTADPT